MSRYSQQVKLAEIGTKGQQKLEHARVLVVGAGGLGTVVATYLASMGIGMIGIADFDVIQETNLHRQFLYNPDEIGLHKATVLASKLKQQNPQIKIHAILDMIHAHHFKDFDTYDLVCDCSDNLQTRIMLDRMCKVHHLPLVHGAVAGWQGYVTLLHYKKQYEYADIFDAKTLLRADSCEDEGITGPICGMIGSVMSQEVLKIVLDMDSHLDGGLMYVHSLTNVHQVLKFKKVV
jgi:adenylyltransferase/sulfurtransferase